jgi:hypothetical protein
MRIAVLALSVVLAAGSAASADELIRYRAPDGTLGLVDKVEKLPPGAVVLERTPLAADRGPETRAAREAEAHAAEAAARGGDEASASSSDAADAPDAPDAAPGSEAAPAEAPRSSHGDATTCIRLGLPRVCGWDAIADARRWCVRSESTRSAVDGAEAELEAAQESYEDCRTANGAYDYCSRERLDSAEAAVEDSQQELDQLQQDCRTAECLPGWIRECCDRGD